MKLKPGAGPGNTGQSPQIFFQKVQDRFPDLAQVIIFKGIEGAEFLGQLAVLQGGGGP